MYGAESEFVVFRNVMGDPPDTDDCWEWAGTINSAIGGYGVLSFGGRDLRAHVVAFRLHVRELEPGEVVRHTCDNPPCCNALRGHLLPGTHADNMADMVSRNRQAKGNRLPHAKLTDDLVRYIRREAAAGVTQQSLADRVGVSPSVISMILSGKIWKHVT